MTLLYITADTIGTPTGGGLVTAQELRALREFSAKMTVERRDPGLSSVEVYSRENLGSNNPEPWKWDQKAVEMLRATPGFEVAPSPYLTGPDQTVPYLATPYGTTPNRIGMGNIPRLCHLYSGTFPWVVASLKKNGCRVCFTIAAHDKEVSKREHEKLGWGFNLPHLTEPKLWQRYIEGYRLADVIVCPSSVAANTVRGYGPEFEKKDIRVIPHGCDLPSEIKPLPKSFVCGYLGSFGADKGVRYLLEAWKKLNYSDGSLLVLAGKDSSTPLARQLIAQYGGGNIHLAGWQKDVSDFYNSISLLVQPSATEGFGIEVLEALAHGRPVLCSEGAGAQDIVPPGWRCKACDVTDMAINIDEFKHSEDLDTKPSINQELALPYTWDKVRKQYQDLWTEVLG